MDFLSWASLMGSLELLKTICVILSFGLEKVSQKYLKTYIIFIQLRMILTMKKNSIYKKLTLKYSPHQY
jgi:hypothetical protein